MINLILIFLSAPAFADNWVRISDVQSGFVRTFELEKECRVSGQSCQKIDGLNFDALKVSGNTVIEDATKMKALDDEKKEKAKKAKDRDDRLKRIEQQCANAEGLVKELCEHILDK